MTDYSKMLPKEARLLFRNGLVRPTSGMCYGYMQISMKAVPRKYAFDFLLYCVRNPVAEPVLEVLEPGVYETKILADRADLRTDLPRYRVFENGRVKEVVTDIKSYWRDDLVTFLMGGSITFEGSLIKAGIPMRHIEENVAVPMYVTNIMTNPAGPFWGGLAVSMRPIRRKLLPRAVEITAKVPRAHGAPVWIGDPKGIGIADINKPDFGGKVTIKDDEVPVFWACGITTFIAAQNAEIEFMLAQDPGYVFIGDIPEEQSVYINTPGFNPNF
jgi:uncharacterized protein YcsI (UPF0317 family)